MDRKLKQKLKKLKREIKRNPDNAEAHNDLGALLDNLGNCKKAEKEYRKALKINPSLAESHANLGFLLLELEDEEKRIEGIGELGAAFLLREKLPDKGESVFNRLKYLYEYGWNHRDETHDKGLLFASKLSDLYFKNEDYNEALRWLDEVWNLREFLDDYGIAGTNLMFGVMCSKLDEFDKARQKISDAKEMFKEQEETELVKVCDEILEELRKLKDAK